MFTFTNLNYHKFGIFTSTVSAALVFNVGEFITEHRDKRYATLYFLILNNNNK